MNKRRPLLGAVLAGALAAAPAMAENFHALSQLPTGFTAMPEAQLASIEGATRWIRWIRIRNNNTYTNNTTTTTTTTTNTKRRIIIRTRSVNLSKLLAAISTALRR